MPDRYNDGMESTVAPSNRPMQLSVRTLMVGVTLLSVMLGVYRIAGWQAFVHYAFLVFAVGPWFAYLASECLPLSSRRLRTAAANLILVAVFFGTIRMSMEIVSGSVVMVIGLAAILLWTPQYLWFIVWNDGDRIA